MLTIPSPSIAEPSGTRATGRAVRLRATGSLDGDAGRELRRMVRNRADGRDRIVLVDVADVDIRDADGLQALSSLRRLRDESPSVVVLRGITAARDEILRVDRHLRSLRRA